MNQTQLISILLCALGGEGGGVLSEWLIDIARHAGYAAQATSIPCVAQPSLCDWRASTAARTMCWTWPG